MSEFSNLARQALRQTQEVLEETGRRKNQLFIGIPKETSFQENRIALTPLSVALLVENGHRVIMESGAGTSANFLDHHYSEQGAKIIRDKKSVYEADIIIKISPPTLEEIEMMKNGQTLFSSQQPSLLSLEQLQAMMKKRITAISYEYLRDEGNILTVVRAMSEIVGATSILIAAEYLSNVFDGKGLMLGGITGVPPTEIVILGAGTVGEYAARTALALGAQVKVFDSSLYRLRRLQTSIGRLVFTSVIQPIVMKKAIISSGVLIGAIRSSNGRCRCQIDESTVEKMKPNSVLID